METQEMVQLITEIKDIQVMMLTIIVVFGVLLIMKGCYKFFSWLLFP